MLTLSIHGDPDYAYPYFTGYANETGEGDGEGFNKNYPLPPKTTAEKYLKAFDRALEDIKKFGTETLIVSLGYDIVKGDPTGTFLLGAETLRVLGRKFAETGLPLLVIQEGGYNIRNIRRGCAEFFKGVAEGSGQPPKRVSK